MTKCWASLQNAQLNKSVKCNRNLVECLASGGQHHGRRFLGKKAGKFLEVAWLDSTQPDVSSPVGQVKLRAEIRRLRYARLDASRLKQPKQYQAFTRKLDLLAGFVVKDRKNRFGVMERINVGTALPIGQQKLEAV